uniref:Uncharacterized protein n=1 Tax=Arion vulgaris TaxID=1028688 RepID=A0A0B6ZNR2_9EUPU
MMLNCTVSCSFFIYDFINTFVCSHNIIQPCFILMTCSPNMDNFCLMLTQDFLVVLFFFNT